MAPPGGAAGSPKTRSWSSSAWLICGPSPLRGRPALRRGRGEGGAGEGSSSFMTRCLSSGVTGASSRQEQDELPKPSRGQAPRSIFVRPGSTYRSTTHRGIGRCAREKDRSSVVCPLLGFGSSFVPQVKERCGGGRATKTRPKEAAAWTRTRPGSGAAPCSRIPCGRVIADTLYERWRAEEALRRNHFTSGAEERHCNRARRRRAWPREEVQEMRSAQASRSESRELAARALASLPRQIVALDAMTMRELR